jgi:putative transposase
MNAARRWETFALTGSRRSRRFICILQQPSEKVGILPDAPYICCLRAACIMNMPTPVVMDPSKAKSRSRTPPTNPGLLELIRAKREWTWKPSIEELKKGFRGWHQRGYLPHFDAPNVTQLVTFMLADSFPVARRAEWEGILNDPGDSTKRRKLEDWLDRGYGDCWLKRPEIAQLVEQLLLEADGHDYRMRAWVVMPNHVHFVVEVREVPLSKLVNLWKGKSAREANKLLGQRGKFWQEDYFDTVVRNTEHLRKAVRYTEQNPVKAFLAKSARDWRWSSARLRDEYERLPWQHERC